MVFKDKDPNVCFTSVAEFDTPVPRFVVGGLSKNFMLPGWRLGWVLLVDAAGCAKDLLRAMHNISSIALGPNHVVQGALPDILANAPDSYFARCTEELRVNAVALADAIHTCPGLSCVAPQGAMFIMVKIDLSLFRDIGNDVEFYEKLHDEENVQVAPGSFFHMPNYFRIVVYRPKNVTDEAIRRIRDFCVRHQKT
ncbi:tyrosine aminotransferase [Trypanosoma grayi]|uniref:tyrosine aminotransferase n=1 Tax=Trypanosoma grayi TaxID=71804 RepID=UPI0004F40555|nr:tyrosine aminotransferase [Trypanosoma grayi]KEG07644.1 tyrosine aminotransferase [Trypanosoma grayi]